MNELSEIKNIPILEVAARLNINVRRKKAFCFSGHDKNTMSLTFSPNKNLWNCFGCGKGGDNISLVQEVYNTDFQGALDWFSSEFGISTKKRAKYRKRRRYNFKSYSIKAKPDSNESAEQNHSLDLEVYSWFISKCGEVSKTIGKKYLSDHGISERVANDFGVKELCDPNLAVLRLTEKWGHERVVKSGLVWEKNKKADKLIWSDYTILFPFFDNESVVYIQGRQFSKQPKFLNLKGISKPLYNINLIRSMNPGDLIHICEGVPDVLALQSVSLSAVGILGASSFKEEWIDFFLRLNVVLLPDGDTGGKTFTKTISENFSHRGKSISIVSVPKGKDVADIIAGL